MRLICFSLFDAPCETFEKRAYIRGFYLNCRMANLIFPDWRIHLDVDIQTFAEYEELFNWLEKNNNVHMKVWGETPALCLGMLWRLSPIFLQDCSRILCRDADALLSYKDACCVQEWIESDYGFHAINDNHAHSGCMGGMMGFDTASLKALTGWNSFEDMIFDCAGFDMTRLNEIKKITTYETAVACSDLNRRGSDQEFLNQKVLPKIKGSILVHNLKGGGVTGASFTTNSAKVLPPQVNLLLYESDLCSFFVGAAGCNELETLRFFKRFEPEPLKYLYIEQRFPSLFYWQI